MKSRCNDIFRLEYWNYGGRGIKICDRWNSFENFYEDMGEPPSNKHSLNRLDNDGNYEPENCVWSTEFEQQRNKRNNIYLSCRGERKVITDWAKQTGISVDTIRYRLRKGWNVEDAIFRPRYSSYEARY
jgi:hypothetical protein